MCPREKAKELMNDSIKIIQHGNNDILICWYVARNLAYLTINQMIKFSFLEKNLHNDESKYWSDVKNEIENSFYN